MVISEKVWGVWIWFWYQIKAERVLLMIPKTHCTQNVTCSLFLWECIPYMVVYVNVHGLAFCGVKNWMRPLNYWHCCYLSVQIYFIRLLLPNRWGNSKLEEVEAIIPGLNGGKKKHGWYPFCYYCSLSLQSILLGHDYQTEEETLN